MKITDHFIPVFTNQLDTTVAYYESLANRTMDRRWDIPEAGLSLATVYPYVIVSGSTEPWSLPDHSVLSCTLIP